MGEQGIKQFSRSSIEILEEIRSLNVLVAKSPDIEERSRALDRLPTLEGELFLARKHEELRIADSLAYELDLRKWRE